MHRGFGLFDADNLRQNVGLSVATNASEVLPGQATFERPVDSYVYIPSSGSSPGNGALENMFDHHKDYGLYVKNHFDGTRACWLPVTMRLTNGAPEIATFDFIHPYASNNMMPKVYTLEGSLNGLNWDMLYMTNSAASVNATTFSWQGAGTGSQNRVLVESSYVHAGGFPIRGHAAEPFEVSGSSWTVSVSGGAAFEVEGAPLGLKRLFVDCDAGGGTIRNVAFADSESELEISKAGYFESLCLPVAFDACVNVENIARWTLLLNGEATAKRLVVRDGSVYVVSPGFTFIIK